jgi:hypothetical protein
MRVGDEIKAKPSDYVAPEFQAQGKKGLPMMSHASPPERAVVEYIHPQRLFYVVRFYYPHGSFCESFKFETRGKTRGTSYENR